MEKVGAFAFSCCLLAYLGQPVLMATCADRWNGPECNDFFRQGDCDGLLKTWMSVNCKKTCGSCSLPPTPTDALAPPDTMDSVAPSSGDIQSPPPPRSDQIVTTNCYDKYADCNFMSDEGDCTDEQRSPWMRANCPMSCGLCQYRHHTSVRQVTECVDTNRQCEARSARGDCQQPTNWMRKSCRKSCNFCMPSSMTALDASTLRPCRNIHVDSDCETYRTRGDCNLPFTRKWMEDNCALTCAFCVPATTTNAPTTVTTMAPANMPCIDFHFRCAHFALARACTNPSTIIWARRKCPKSCGLCTVQKKIFTVGGTANGAPCIFPFTYSSSVHYQCTSASNDRPWCYTSIWPRKWGNCVPETVTTTLTTPVFKIDCPHTVGALPGTIEPRFDSNGDYNTDAMVLFDHKIPCPGYIDRFTYLRKNKYTKAYVGVLRPSNMLDWAYGNPQTSYTMVGYNEIPTSTRTGLLRVDVPPSKQIRVQEGDILIYFHPGNTQHGRTPIAATTRGRGMTNVQYVNMAADRLNAGTVVNMPGNMRSRMLALQANVDCSACPHDLFVRRPSS